MFHSKNNLDLSNEIILLLKVCKYECIIVTLLSHSYSLGLYVTCNVRGIDWIRNWIVKGIEQFSALRFVADVMV